MSYNLMIKESYKGYPTSMESINFTQSITSNSIDELRMSVIKSLKEIKTRHDVIRSWTECEENGLIFKVLYKSLNGHGRLLRVHEIRKNKRQCREEISLI